MGFFVEKVFTGGLIINCYWPDCTFVSCDNQHIFRLFCSFARLRAGVCILHNFRESWASTRWLLVRGLTPILSLNYMHIWSFIQLSFNSVFLANNNFPYTLMDWGIITLVWFQYFPTQCYCGLKLAEFWLHEPSHSQLLEIVMLVFKLCATLLCATSSTKKIENELYKWLFSVCLTSIL